MGMLNTRCQYHTLVPLISTSPLLWSQTVPLVVGSDQTGPIYSQDAIADPQSAV